MELRPPYFSRFIRVSSESVQRTGRFSMVQKWYHTITSRLITTMFLTVLMICAIWHNFLTSHIFKRKQRVVLDPRDTRPANVITPQTTSHSHMMHRHTQSFSSSAPIEVDVEVDDVNNIEYDRTITRRVKARDTDFNPFADVLSGEDLKLVPNLQYYYSQYNIVVDEYEVTTKDGFVLELWHLRKKDESEFNDRYPILMLHGLLQSSGSFASAGRKSLAYYVHDSGYDVWLGNNRCGFKSKWDREKLAPNGEWDWDLNTMTRYDLETLVDAVLEKKQHKFEKLSLIAHSQGTTQAFMGLVNEDDIYKVTDFRLSSKLDNFVALAPAVYPGPLLDEKLFVKFMAKHIDNKWVFGDKSFVPLMMEMRDIMAGHKIFSFLSYVMFNFLFNWNDILWDRPLRDRHFLFSPVHISVKLMQWWLSLDPLKSSFKTFAEDMFPDVKTWFPVHSESTSMDEHLHKNEHKPVTQDWPKILLFIPRQDRLVDGERLINHFINHEPHSIFKIWYIDEYSHLDVLWAGDVIERIGKPMLENMYFPEQHSATN